MADNRERHSEWTMSQERAFLEDLVSKRFHFFIVMFFAIVAGGVASNDQHKLIVVLVLGALICSAFSLTVYRAHVKLDQALKLLHAEADHPVRILGEATKKLGVKGLFGVAWIVGVLPLVLSLVLIVAASLAYFGVVRVR